ncbi:hypothetical protein TRV_02729 [Trichophyton verrucosum HKI 0517]|uniref:SprT-like domain-containing protein n=1 Tax=Trichophyton verrucosum (strain HKI 0517) TaxID=663202 RepID=D4D6K3_TRIVH|nr:uncharacterized protein TRV_02729 [Trichophyton verrucosum HKI 0517]EFE42532.1 hypothetical protein TRV_02729 [Trichophyton verrucosum HKI 0517]
MSPHPKCICRTYPEASEEKSGSGLRALKASSLQCIGISEVLATKLALDALESFRAPHLETPRCPLHGYKYLPFRLFNTLDSHLFRGVLKDQVYLRWSKILPSRVHGLTSKPGSRDNRITIDLQHSLIKESSAEGIISVLIHHMAHAYFLACCGPPSLGKNRSERQNLGHDLAYSTLVYKIMDVFQPQGFNRMPNLFLFDRARHHLNDHRQLCRAERTVGHLAEPGKCCTYQSTDFLDRKTCRDHTLTLKELHLKHERDGTSDLGDPYPKSHYIHVVDLVKQRFTPVLRSQYRYRPKDYIELHYENYAVPFLRSGLRKDCSLASKISEDVNFLNIPAPSHQIFCAFYSYLLNGDYPPELVKITSPYITARNAEGPPLILTYVPELENFLATDIRMFSLASMLDFSDLRDSAMHRMHSLSETHANPISILQEIYNSPTRNDDDRDGLRRWVLEFLPKGGKERGFTNIDVLQTGQWSDSLAKLRKENGLFNMDYSTAFESLVLEKASAYINAYNEASRATGHAAGNPSETFNLGTLSSEELELLRQVHPQMSKLYETAVASTQKQALGPKVEKQTNNDCGSEHCFCHVNQQTRHHPHRHHQQQQQEEDQDSDTSCSQCPCYYCVPVLNEPNTLRQTPNPQHCLNVTTPLLFSPSPQTTCSPINFIPVSTHHRFR